MRGPRFYEPFTDVIEADNRLENIETRKINVMVDNCKSESL